MVKKTDNTKSTIAVITGDIVNYKAIKDDKINIYV